MLLTIIIFMVSVLQNDRCVASVAGGIGVGVKMVAIIGNEARICQNMTISATARSFMQVMSRLCDLIPFNTLRNTM